MACDCPIALSKVCQYEPDGNWAAATYLNGNVVWYDVETGAVVPSGDVNCGPVVVGPPLIPDFVPGNVIDIQFTAGTEETTQAQRQFFIDARDDFEACFNTNPIVYNGTNKITLDFSMRDDLPAGVIANAGPTAYRRVANGGDDTTLTGSMRFAPVFYAGSESNRRTFFHEMTHVLGMVTGQPRWAPLLRDIGTADAGWTGPLAVAAFNAMPGKPGPPVDRVPVQFGPASAHWNENNAHNIPGDCFQRELMSPIADGNQDMSPVTAAAIRDMGYDWNGGCAIVNNAYVCGQP